MTDEGNEKIYDLESSEDVPPQFPEVMDKRLAEIRLPGGSGRTQAMLDAARDMAGEYAHIHVIAANHPQRVLFVKTFVKMTEAPELSGHAVNFAGTRFHFLTVADEEIRARDEGYRFIDHIALEMELRRLTRDFQ